MKKNDLIELHVVDLHANGSGVGKKDGLAVFIPGALPGETICVKILKVLKKYAYGKIHKIIKASPHRIKSLCPVADKCGGCQFQHYEYSAQLSFKEKLVSDVLARIGDCKKVNSSPIQGMDKPYQYRNKAQFPKGLGFYAARSHRIVPIDNCNIHHPACAEVLQAIKKLDLPLYDEETNTGLLRHVVVRVGFATNEVMVILVLNGKWPGLPIDLPHTIIINKNKAKTNVILGPHFTTIQGSGYIHEEIGHIRYRISPRAFFQVNPTQTKILYDTVASHISPSTKVIDAYSGIGGIALYIANLANEVTGVESVEEAVEDANYNAKLNKINNASFLCAPAEEAVPKLLKESHYDTLILDPPRKGCDIKLLEAAATTKTPQIIYVSCDPATQARDIKFLSQNGYHLKSTQAIDLFPMTGHVENLCVLTI